MSKPLLPIFIKLEGRACLVVGAGAVGLQKVRSLLECGALVTVVAPRGREEFTALAKAEEIEWRQRSYLPEDLRGRRLVIAATDAPEVNHAIYCDAVAAGLLANAVDDPPFCDFYFGSVVRRGALQIGISTAGESPALAQRLRQQVERMLDGDVGAWLERLGALRREVIATHPGGESCNELLRALATREVCDAAHCPSRQMAHGSNRKFERSWWLT